MKNAVILHGHGSTEQSFWHPYLKNRLEEKGYTVWLPTLPNTEHPRLDEQLRFIQNNWDYTEESIIIGHSSGVPLAISLIESLNIRIHLSIFVSGFITAIDDESVHMLKKAYDWDKIKANIEKPIIINSDNDPWGCNDKQGRQLFERIGGMQIILHGEGHMGSDFYKQPYKEFPLLPKLIDAYD
jgi:predicted alpha/beta hydrolase family esterase